jgi:Flp pilus assembly pilin Flp
MTRVSRWLQSRLAAFLADDHTAQGLAEYALILTLVALLSVPEHQGQQGAISGSLATNAAQF